MSNPSGIPLAGTYFWGLMPAQIQYFIYAGFAVNMLMFVVIQLIAGRFEKRTLLISLSLFAAVDSITMVTLRLFDVLPDNGSALLLPMIVTTYALGTLAGAISGVIGRSMVADVVDEQELVTGERQEVMFFSALAFSGKAVSGLGTMLGGIVLSVVGFPPSIDAMGVPPDVVFRMGVFMGPILGTLHMIPILLYLLYRLDRRRHAEIHAQLEDLRESRKRAEEPEVPLVAAGS